MASCGVNQASSEASTSAWLRNAAHPKLAQSHLVRAADWRPKQRSDVAVQTPRAAAVVGSRRGAIALGGSPNRVHKVLPIGVDLLASMFLLYKSIQRLTLVFGRSI
jgi:hypothetical protein